MEWAYGITTVPKRRHNLLEQTIASLSQAGFPNPRLFIDGCGCNGADDWSKFNLEITCRYPCIGCAGNWILSLWELHIRQPRADRYVIFQDDLVAYKNLRQYLERCRLPSRAYYNLFTFNQNRILATEQGWFPSNQKGKGAVALMFTPEAIEVLLTHRHLFHRCRPVPDEPTRHLKNIDGGIVECFRQAGWQEYCHHPSLVQHMGGHSSTIGNSVYHPAPAWRGESFDALQLLKGKEQA